MGVDLPPNLPCSREEEKKKANVTNAHFLEHTRRSVAYLTQGTDGLNLGAVECQLGVRASAS